MNLINPKRLEEIILVLLSKGEQITTTLLSNVRLIRKDTTKQGFYAALRKLKAEEIILIYKGTASLNTVWIKKMKDEFEKISRVYTVDQNSFDVLGLKDKENISYLFSDVRSLDIFWGHSQNILMHNTNKTEPIYAYDPHYCFYIARKQTETELLKEIVQNKRQFLMTVGNTTKLDKIIKKDFNNDYLQYNYGKTFDKQNYYITVIGDYITEVYLNEALTKRIKDLYETADSINQKVIDEFNEILKSKVKNKIKISRNRIKAIKLKKKLGKDFYIIRENI